MEQSIETRLSKLKRLANEWQIKCRIADAREVASDSEHIAERNGAAAWVQFVASKMRPNCPYPAGSPLSVAWYRGWNKG
jgi:hypothetical protein